MGNQIRHSIDAVLVGLAILVTGIDAAAGEPEWKVGFAQIKITPEQPMLMSGYAGRTKPFEKVGQDLYAKALVLEDREGRRGVILTSDLLGFPAAVAEPICERLTKIGLKREQILLNSAHTHAGPQLGLKAPQKDAAGAAEGLRTVEDRRQLQDKVVEVVTRARRETATRAAILGRRRRSLRHESPRVHAHRHHPRRQSARPRRSQRAGAARRFSRW